MTKRRDAPLSTSDGKRDRLLSPKPKHVKKSLVIFHASASIHLRLEAKISYWIPCFSLNALRDFHCKDYNKRRGWNLSPCAEWIRGFILFMGPGNKTDSGHYDGNGTVSNISGSIL